MSRGEDRFFAFQFGRATTGLDGELGQRMPEMNDLVSPSNHAETISIHVQDQGFIRISLSLCYVYRFPWKFRNIGPSFTN